MNRKYSLLLVLITAIFELAFLVWTRADYRSTLLDGEEYEVPAAIEFQGNFYDRNYIAVNVPITETKWEGEREPETGETIYLVIRKGQKGALILDHAQPAQPSGSYIKTRALRIMDGTVYFNFPADRMYMAPEQLKKLSVVELSERVQVPEDNGKTKTAMKNEITTCQGEGRTCCYFQSPCQWRACGTDIYNRREKFICEIRDQQRRKRPV